MPRPPRDFKPGKEYFVRQRGNNGNIVFRDEGDRRLMRALIAKYSAKFAVHISFFEMWERTVQMIVIPSSPEGVPRFMQAVIGSYSRFYNRKYSRKGHLWQNRYFTAA